MKRTKLLPFLVLIALISILFPINALASTPEIKSLKADLASKQPVGTTITLTATPKTSGNYIYEFSYILGSTSKNAVEIPISQDQVSGNTCEFTPTEIGSYTFYCRATDENGNESEVKTLSGYKIIENVSVKSLKINKTAPQNTGTKLTISATAENGRTPYQYQFSYTLNGGDEVVLQEFYKTSYVRFTLEEGGNYIFYVQVKDTHGNLSQKVATDTFYVTGNPVIEDLTVTQDSPQNIGTELDLTATASQGTGNYTFEFYYQLDRDDMIQISDADVSGNTAVFTPTEEGSYTFYVRATDDSGNSSDLESSKRFKVTDSVSVKYIAVDKTAPQNIDTRLRITAAATDGKSPYQYQFAYQIDGGDITVIQDFTQKSYLNFTPEVAGTYTFYVQVKDDYGNLSAQTASDEFVVVDKPIVEDLSVTQTSPQNLGTTLDLTASATGGTGDYTYEFYFQLDKNDMVQISDADVTGNTAVFTPAEEGSYTFYVKATDDSGNISELEHSSRFKITETVTVKYIKIDKTAPQNIGTRLKITASANNGKTPYKYQFAYQLDGGDMTVVQDYSTKGYLYFTPEVGGTYTFYVQVEDGYGNLSAQLASEEFIVVDDPIVDDLSVTEKSPQNLGTTLNLTATATGGTGNYTYEFYYQLDKNTMVQISDADVTGNTAVFTPTEAGYYVFYVVATDDSGNGSEIENSSRFKITETVTVRYIKVDKTAPQNIGTKLKISAAATDGKSPYQYEFSYQLNGGDITSIKTYSSSTYTYFTPTEGGTYTFYVQVKDGYGNLSAQTASDEFIVVDDPIIDDLTITQKSPQNLGTQIDLTATATGGTGNYTYEFYYQLDSNTMVQISDTDVTGNAAVFNSTDAGYYTFYVKCTDDSGNVSEIENSSRIKVTETVSVRYIKVNKKTPQNTGTELKIYASATNGKSPYQYQYSYQLDDGDITIVQDYSTNRYLYFTPEVGGTYTFYVQIKDGYGNVSAQVASDEFVIESNEILADLSIDCESPQNIGTGLNLTATSVTNGIAPYQYQFSYQLDGGDLTVIQDFSSRYTVHFTPEEDGDYTFYVQVKDSRGDLSELIAGDVFVITNNPIITDLDTDLRSGHATTKTPVTVTTTVEHGIEPFTYAYSYSSAEGESGTVDADMITDNTASLLLSEAGYYTITATVTDAVGNSSTETIENYHVNEHVSISDVQLLTTGVVQVGDKVVLTASKATGGFPSYTYQFYYTVDGGEMVTITILSRANSIEFTPPEAGTYTFYATATDRYGYVSDQVYSVEYSVSSGSTILGQSYDAMEEPPIDEEPLIEDEVIRETEVSIDAEVEQPVSTENGDETTIPETEDPTSIDQNEV